MPPEEERLSLLQERIAVNELAAKAAHTRIDKMEQINREEMKDLRADIRAIPNEITLSMKPFTDKVEAVHSWMNQGKGVASGAMFIAAAVGGIITFVATNFPKWMAKP